MQGMIRPCAVFCLTLALGWSRSALAAQGTVNESAREIPVACEADVVVVGGGTGAVAAAVAAAEAGASVFLAAPYPYLGDDMTATLRLWLEEGETPVHPLAEKIFAETEQQWPAYNAHEFAYQTDIASASLHRDTSPPSLLADGRWGDASRESVQYDDDVTITAELGQSVPIQEVRVVVYCRAGETGFNVERVNVAVSDDKRTWRPVAEAAGHSGTGGDFYAIRVPVDQTARFVQITARKPENVARILLGEIEILSPEPATAARPSAPPSPRPMHIKKTLDDALLTAGVKYLYSCLATDVLRDASGKPCGIVMANRSGRQAIVAKTIIDATDRALVARWCGAAFSSYPAGVHTFRRTVIGGETLQGEGLAARVIEPPFRGPYPNVANTSSGRFQIIEYTLKLPLTDDSYGAWMRADQQARTLTYHPEQQYTSDVLFELPPDAMQGRQAATGPWQGVEQLPLGAFQPAGVDRVFVLSGCVDVPRDQVEKVLRPLALIDAGTRLGQAAAEQSQTLAAPQGLRLGGQQSATSSPRGDVREELGGIRLIRLPRTVPQDMRALPVLGTYDVVVIGGGTGGAPAGIAAARQGAKTLVVEYLCGLGGVGTEGAIASYYWGNRVGFTATVLDGARTWPIEPKKEWWRQELLQAGAEIWFNALGCGAFVDGQQVKGAVVATPWGRGVVLAKIVIDATGNSDVAAAAGAATYYTDAEEFGMQGTGLPGRKLGTTYNNTDFNIVDETDMVDVWQTFVYSKGKYPDAFDHGRLIDTRERRRIVGEATITLVDQMNQRTYPDTVCRAWSNFDTHGYTTDKYTLVEHPEKKGVFVDIPYRAMLPKDREGILVIGLGISAHRDAVPLIRMQPDIQNGGYAAGLAAATAAAANKGLRAVEIRALQQQLTAIGNLPPEVLTHQDSYPMSPESIAAAVKSIPEGTGAAVVLAHPDQALPLVKEAFASAPAENKLAYAQLLSVLGDTSGLDVMLAKLTETAEWDEGWNYRGMGQFGQAYSPLDALVVNIGHTGFSGAVPAIVDKLENLGPNDAFSHHRAVARALELIGDSSAARPLAELLSKPGMSGYHHPDIQTAIEREVPGGTNAETTRRESLRELLLARALYRCGDHNAVGRTILENYTKDLRGHLARHAQAVLDEKK